MSKPRIWIDMTDLSTWNGHMTGVQRVVYQNAKRFFASPEYDTHFFVFRERQKIFSEIDFAQVQGQIEATSEPDAQGQAVQPAAWKHKVKAVPRAMIGHIPSAVKQKIPIVVKQSVRKGFHLGVRVARRGQHEVLARVRPVTAPEEFVPVSFAKDDTVLLMGKTWDLPDLMASLGRLKAKHGFKLVHLVHDMIPVFETHLFGPGLFEPYTRNMFEVCALSDGLLAVSQSTRKDLERFCNELHIVQPPIGVVRLGDDLVDMVLPANEPAPDPRIKKGEFIFQPGTIEVRKNHALVYMAYREAALRGITLPTWVIMGSPGWLTGDIIWQMEHDPLLKDRIVILRGLSDRGKLWLYQNCQLVVFPSTYEGWGMPVGEALAYGKVCITSTMSSMPEIGGKAADYVSPYNSQQMLDLLLKYQDPKALAVREKQITKSYRLATWDDTFAQLKRFMAERAGHTATATSELR